MIKNTDGKQATRPEKDILKSIVAGLMVSTCLSLIPTSAHAADPTANPGAALAATSVAAADPDIFPAAFFSQYVPQSAMDMIDRLPGFTFDGGTKTRGFGGGAGNVLVDGVRPVSKNTDLRTLLDRIPAAQVARVEILQGGASASEAAGQAIVANIILKEAGSSGRWEAAMHRAPDGRVRPNANLTFLTKLGGWDTEFSAKFKGDPRDQVGTIRRRDADGAQTSVQDEGAPSQLLAGVASLRAARSFENGRLVLNVSHERGRWDGQTTRLGFASDETAASDHWYLDGLNRWRKGELGLDWSQKVGSGWTWRLIGLGSYVNRNNGYELTDTDLATNQESFEDYRHIKRLSELIGRTTLGRSKGAFKPEVGVEVAKNRLRNDIDRVLDGDSIPLAAADVVVEELRGEAFVTATYDATPALTLTGGLTAEASKVIVSGDAAEDQSFKFLKPRLSATYSFSDDLQLTLEAERKVGQLDLSDFAASSEEEDGLVTAGNPLLRPDKTTRVSAILSWSFGERGSLRVEPFHEWRSDILEQVMLPSGSAGLGNAGDGRFWGLDANLNLPVEALIPGGLLMAKLHLENSRFKDPLLGGAVREISSYKPGGSTRAPHPWTIEFRQDLPDLQAAWGAELKSGFTERVFLVGETQELTRKPDVSAFVETSKYLGAKIRLELLRLNNRKEDRLRTFYGTDRAGEVSGFELASRRKRTEIRLKVTAAF